MTTDGQAPELPSPELCLAIERYRKARTARRLYLATVKDPTLLDVNATLDADIFHEFAEARKAMMTMIEETQ